MIGALVFDRPETPEIVRALEQGKLLAARTGDGGKVYFPPKEADPATGKELDQFVELGDTGTVTTFAIINIPFPGQRIKPPYVAAYVLLDGADIPFLHLVTEIDAAVAAQLSQCVSAGEFVVIAADRVPVMP